MFNRERYFERIGMSICARDANLTLLNQLIYAHQCHIPFENLSSCDLGEEVSLDEDRLYEKIILGNRGGYCLELNTLFCMFLVELGFNAYTSLFRVFENDVLYPAEHLGIIVTIDGYPYYVDVGFGGPMPPFAVKITQDKQTEHGETYWTEPFNDSWIWLKRLRGHGILTDDNGIDGHAQIKVGALSLKAADSKFIVQLNEHLSRSSESYYCKERLVNLRTADGYLAIVGNTYVEVINGQKTVQPVNADLGEILWDRFGIAYCLDI